MTAIERTRERVLPKPHDFTTLNGLDCLQCPLPEGNAVHAVSQRSLLTDGDTSRRPAGPFSRPRHRVA